MKLDAGCEVSKGDCLSGWRIAGCLT